jgi:hypothetical protein
MRPRSGSLPVRHSARLPTGRAATCVRAGLRGARNRRAARARPVQASALTPRSAPRQITPRGPVSARSRISREHIRIVVAFWRRSDNDLGGRLRLIASSSDELEKARSESGVRYTRTREYQITGCIATRTPNVTPANLEAAFFTIAIPDTRLRQSVRPKPHLEGRGSECGFVYRRMRDAVSSGQPKATSLRACARSTRASSAMIAERTRSKPRPTNWSWRQTRVRCASPDWSRSTGN